MKYSAVRVLAGMCLLFVIVLGVLWFDADGVRNVRWSAPVALEPDFGALLENMPERNAQDISRFTATIERPLFSPTRRPPPAGAVAVEAAQDALSDLRLHGLFSAGEHGGIIATVGGSMRRIQTGEKIGEWTLSGIDGREALLSRGDESRRLYLPYAWMTSADLVSASPANSGDAQSVQMTPQQRLEERNRERLQRRNELRAEHGLPPISQ